MFRNILHQDDMERSDALDLLAFGAHPDDVEIGAAGILIKHAQRGERTGICDLTLAELSSNGSVERRVQEALRASREMMLSERINLQLPDRGISLSEEYLAAVVSVLRHFRPRVVLAPFWTDRHPDHEWTSQLVREGVFNAKIRKYRPDLGEAHQVQQVYYYFINHFETPDVIVDITGVYPAKQRALSAYESQFLMEKGSVITPLNQEYVTRVAARDQLFGQQIGAGYGEGLKMKGPVSLDYLVP